MDRLPENITQLEHRLLLHAADELSPAERSALESALARNPAEQEALDGMRELLSGTGACLAALDKSEPIAPRAVRRASDRAVRAVFAWTETEREARVLRKGRRHPLAEGMVWRYARWPLAAAALLVVGLMIWTFSVEAPQNRGPIAVDQRTAVTVDSSEVIGTAPNQSVASSEIQFEAIAALFESYARTDGGDALELELAGATSQDLAALRLLEEPDYE